MAANGTFRTLLIGAIFSIITAFLTVYLQYVFATKEKTTQLYLDEKQNFVNACEEYLKQYRQWHEMMNYLTFDSARLDKYSEFDDSSFAVTYRQWKKDFDFSYGKIFLLSDNEFGTNTVAISDVLHSAILLHLKSKEPQEIKEKRLTEIDRLFMEEWLSKAQQEIFKYNTGKRVSKSVKEQMTERRQKIADSIELKKSIDQMYRELEKANGEMKRSGYSGMPTREEFEKMIKRSKR